MKKAFLVFLFLIGGCSTSPQKPLDDSEKHNQEILRGAWGWSENQCKSNPVTISFSDDGKYMYHDSPQGVFLGSMEKAYKRVKYSIHFQVLGYIATSIENEDRTDDEGNPVSWDLVIQSRDRFCWHRTDWDEGSCTKSMIKCE